MKLSRALLIAAFGSVSIVAAATVETDYHRVANERADKIAAEISSISPGKVTPARDLIAAFYMDLNETQQARDAAIQRARANAALDKSGRDSAIAQARDVADASRAQIHDAFVAKLTDELTPAQVDAIKDALTYKVVPVTFRVYQQMLPDLTVAQKEQIHAWLLEAREHALTGFTANEKHAWFGKYKGRINNFLSKAGYDMKAAEKNLHAQR